MTFKPAAAALVLLSVAAAAPVIAQQRVDGAIQQHGFLNQAYAPQEFQIVHGVEFKGAHKIAISVFNVAFPNENHFTANTKGHSYYAASSSSAKMSTTLSGVDKATRQRIADEAYADFVQALKAAGYEVVDAAELARLAPEYGKWPVLPNFSEGRFGSYVAPTGMQLRFLQGDGAKRDTSGALGQQMSAFRVLDRPIAFDRSPYIAHDGNLGVVAVTLVVDYGVYSSSGEKKGMGKASGGFKPGVTIAAGNISDQGTMLEYWGPKSGGFPAGAFLQLPIYSDAEVGVISGAEGSGDFHLNADAAKFEKVAVQAVGTGVGKLVAAMAAGR